MSEMVKRVAGVFADELERLQAEGHIEIRATADFSSKEIAKRLIEAMREPTAAMAMVDTDPEDSTRIWHKMIDEALK